MRVQDFPVINATLNGTSAVLLMVAYISIRLRRVRTHAGLMIAATCTSAAFLCCYLIYHYKAGERTTKDLPGIPPWLRVVYLAILFPHLILAIVMLPMIVLSFWRAYHLQWDLHRRIARPTFWIWFYVSVTGVLIYWMLYHLFPALKSASA